MRRPHRAPPPGGHYSVVGIGAGPANLSVAALLYEDGGLPNLFVDRKERFSWHDDQLISGATLQVSVFKDLVSMTDPTSPFSFTAYLNQQGRMYHFLNAQFAAVPRGEFRNYLSWAAETNENVVFGEGVREVDFDGVFRIRTDAREVTADNIVIGVGTLPWLPDFVAPHLGADHFHVSRHLRHAAGLAGKTVAVVGGGQSGAEAFLDLVSRPAVERPSSVIWIAKRRNFFPIDDSAFTNDLFMPEYSDYFHRLPRDIRSEIIASHILTSDGISEDTLRSIYQQLYHLRFIDDGDHPFGLYPNRTVEDLQRLPSGRWELVVSHNDEADSQSMVVDAAVWATGFRPAPKDFLEPLLPRMQSEGGELKVDDDFAAVWDGPADRRIFLQNAARAQRGLPDVNLSLNAWRAQRIVNRLRGDCGRSPLPSFIQWSAKTESEAPWNG
ncbi:lysine N(6)-hydroxylase/L-ornithine N(5)-oxygenase family protein [Glycomyces xiaoerkulensis]|uniref:lysine N(6)-hydroxylase/L-ornithine N(5)-oxygenase family protein n=1 Tax=Glycomyces xiaoerkulensis TaxID=2038139 RepID=UPI000C2643AC|nr:SidA/IucD/PvdA family monooxygenase [Glycomyces xiaoerkulensis]